MLLLVNSCVVSMEYVPFEKPEIGHVLIILVTDSTTAREIRLHELLPRALEIGQVKGGLMSDEEIRDGSSQIRIMGGTMLEAIDLMRLAGLGVTEVV